MKTRRLVLVALSTTLLGCGTTLAPGAEQVVITKKAEDVKGCKVVGPVSFNRTMKYDTLKNHVYAMGGDTMFLTRHDTFAGTGSVGIAYICRGIDPRQPVPATNPKREKD
jgi:hypothetical protein